MVCTNLLGYYNLYAQFTELPTAIFMTKGTFTTSDESTKKVKLKVTFFVTTWISTKLNHNGKGHVLLTLIQFHVRRKSIVKVTFNRNSGKPLAPDTYFTAAS